MAYAIKRISDGFMMFIGYQEQETDSDGEFYKEYWYMYDEPIYYNKYDSYIEAKNDLEYACMDGMYIESDYEIVEV